LGSCAEWQTSALGPAAPSLSMVDRQRARSNTLGPIPRWPSFASPDAGVAAAGSAAGAATADEVDGDVAGDAACTADAASHHVQSTRQPCLGHQRSRCDV